MNNQAYASAFKDELEKLGFKFPWQKKKRKKKNKESWKSKFASSIQNTISEHNLDTRFGKSIGRIILKRGL